MSILPLTFVRPWNIHTPQVVRELDTEFVDAFFKDGSLRISSFAKFQEHPDEQRRDGKEGQMAVDVKIANGGYVSSRGKYGNAYVLSSSLH
jgi:hypothetical protein